MVVITPDVLDDGGKARDGNFVLHFVLLLSHWNVDVLDGLFSLFDESNKVLEVVVIVLVVNLKNKV